MKVSKIKEGNTLLVSEGNWSFTISLVKKLQLLYKLITFTYGAYSYFSRYM
ncbi:hypothetical protein Cyrtocomes_01162 [Candidatus Cyrtobacter comes]|uniref:Uncharacterized protein n=1 Tax=Candidatus Cyrtobacter comes TaxID=675776 RepID=A0ABU5L9G9_9RICK|nr:hypothetical protein [Candidatus Cyrtobacter comes]